MMHLLRLVTEQSSTIGKEELRARPTLTCDRQPFINIFHPFVVLFSIDKAAVFTEVAHDSSFYITHNITQQSNQTTNKDIQNGKEKQGTKRKEGS